VVVAKAVVIEPQGVFRHCTNVRDGAIESTVESRIPDMTTTPSTTPKPRRRWLQFSLRTNLVFVQCGLAAERVLSESGGCCYSAGFFPLRSRTMKARVSLTRKTLERQAKMNTRAFGTRTRAITARLVQPM